MFMTDRRIYFHWSARQIVGMGAEDIKQLQNQAEMSKPKARAAIPVYHPDCTLSLLPLICEQFTTAHFYLIADGLHKSGS